MTGSVPTHRLLERADSILVLVDVQPGFFDAHDQLDRGALARAVSRCAWLAGVAAALEVPTLVTEEDAPRNGPTDESVRVRLAAGTPVFAKRVFGLAGQPDIVAAIEGSGRRTAVLAGTETDVCVAQSALGLLERGFRVVVVGDATFSPGEMHEHGMRRMRDAGVLEAHAKGVYYEWVRTLEAARAFEDAHPELARPPGFPI